MLYDGMPLCRDALAVLRRRYGFENSPSKRQNGRKSSMAGERLALEQVSGMVVT